MRYGVDLARVPIINPCRGISGEIHDKIVHNVARLAGRRDLLFSLKSANFQGKSTVRRFAGWTFTTFC
jgi:hypothetical protein